MPRPEVDVPPDNRLAPTGKIPSIREAPSLDQLRTSLVKPRFELLKGMAFAAFLLILLGIALCGSHLEGRDNQFAANGAAAFTALSTALSSNIAWMRAKAKAVHLDASLPRTASVTNAQSYGGRAMTKPHMEKPTSREASSKLSGIAKILPPDALAAGIAGLLLYILFVRILIRRRGGLRAFSRSPVA